jgi:hypothetical protein
MELHGTHTQEGMGGLCRAARGTSIVASTKWPSYLNLFCSMPLVKPSRLAHTLRAERTGQEPDSTVQGCWQGSGMWRRCGHTAHTGTHRHTPSGVLCLCSNRGGWLKHMHTPACPLPACNINNNSDTTQNCRAGQQQMPTMTTSNSGRCKMRDAMGCLLRHALECTPCQISCCLRSSNHSAFVPGPSTPATGRPVHGPQHHTPSHTDTQPSTTHPDYTHHSALLPCSHTDTARYSCNIGQQP